MCHLVDAAFNLADVQDVCERVHEQRRLHSGFVCARMRGESEVYLQLQDEKILLPYLEQINGVHHDI